MTRLVGACGGAAAAACACGGLGGPARGPVAEAPLLLLLCACGRVGGRGTGNAAGAAGSAAGDGATGGAPILAVAGQPRCRGRTDYHCQRVPQICRPEFERPIGVGL